MLKKFIDKAKELILPLIVLILFLGFWEFFASLEIVDNIIIPKFSEVIKSIIINNRELYSNLFVTAFESVSAFIIGSLLAFLLAIVFVLSKTVKNSFLPFAIAIKATPLIALAPALILWFGNGLESKIVMGSLVAFFPVLINSLEGLQGIEKEQLDLMKSYSATRLQTLLKLQIPNSLPFVFSSLKISSTLAVVGVIIGEFTGATQGLGHIIVNSSYYLNTPLMFAAILLISFWGIIFYSIIDYIEKIFMLKINLKQ